VEETRLRGTRCSGFGIATQTLKQQLPLMAVEFPEIADCHFGTINIALDSSLIVLHPDHRTKAIEWAPGRFEVFDLVRIGLEVPYGGIPRPAWLYVAHDSPHRATPHVHEVIGPRIDFGSSREIGIIIHRQCTRLAYQAQPTYVVE